MTILVFDENLMWSAKLKSAIEHLGHEAVLFDRVPGFDFIGDVAIVNLGSSAIPARELIEILKQKSIKSIAHAGHKEKPLLLVGTESGADLVVTNSELTHKFEDVLQRASVF